MEQSRREDAELELRNHRGPLAQRSRGRLDSVGCREQTRGVWLCTLTFSDGGTVVERAAWYQDAKTEGVSVVSEHVAPDSGVLRITALCQQSKRELRGVGRVGGTTDSQALAEHVGRAAASVGRVDEKTLRAVRQVPATPNDRNLREAVIRSLTLSQAEMGALRRQSKRPGIDAFGLWTTFISARQACVKPRKPIFG